MPVIVWCALGLLWTVPFPGELRTAFPAANWATVAAIAAVVYYAFLSPRLALGVVQFIGHAIEGRRPSFFKDLQFLLIGPLWLLADVYRRAGLRY